MNKRHAVVCFNLGGPNTSEEIEFFLKNLLTDRYVMPLPSPLRTWFGSWIARRRTPVAKEIYAQIGGASPLLKHSLAQANALNDVLGHDFYKVFMAMRHGHPLIEEVVPCVQQYNPAQITLLPLYPQYSFTTTASAFAQWNMVTKKLNWHCPTHQICCYPTLHGLISYYAQAIEKYALLFEHMPQILFTAHGIPQYLVRKGDPYVHQVTQTVQAIMQSLPKKFQNRYKLAYQSRLGPLKWTEPYLTHEIKRAGAMQHSLLVVPISFTQEHVETWVELDIEMHHLAQKSGVPEWHRIPTVQQHDAFIDDLAQLVLFKNHGEKRQTSCSTCGVISRKAVGCGAIEKSRYI